jgi:hypothetical protein
MRSGLHESQPRTLSTWQGCNARAHPQAVACKRQHASPIPQPAHLQHLGHARVAQQPVQPGRGIAHARLAAAALAPAASSSSAAAATAPAHPAVVAAVAARAPATSSALGVGPRPGPSFVPAQTLQGIAVHAAARPPCGPRDPPGCGAVPTRDGLRHLRPRLLTAPCAVRRPGRRREDGRARATLVLPRAGPRDAVWRSCGGVRFRPAHRAVPAVPRAVQAVCRPLPALPSLNLPAASALPAPPAVLRGLSRPRQRPRHVPPLRLTPATAAALVSPAPLAPASLPASLAPLPAIRSLRYSPAIHIRPRPRPSAPRTAAVPLRPAAVPGLTHLPAPCPPLVAPPMPHISAFALLPALGTLVMPCRLISRATAQLCRVLHLTWPLAQCSPAVRRLRPPAAPLRCQSGALLWPARTAARKKERKKERSTPVSRRALRGHSVNEDHRAAARFLVPSSRLGWGGTGWGSARPQRGADEGHVAGLARAAPAWRGRDARAARFESQQASRTSNPVRGSRGGRTRRCYRPATAKPLASLTGALVRREPPAVGRIALPSFSFPAAP